MAAPYSLIAKSKAPSRQRQVLRRGAHQREAEAELGLEARCDAELARCGIDRDGVCAPAGEPRRDIRRAAPELDRAHAVEVVGQQTDLGLGDPEDAPPGLAPPGPTPRDELAAGLGSHRDTLAAR